MKRPWLNPAWMKLRQQLAQQRLAHAVVLQGETGIGKIKLAMHLAKVILCQTSEYKACGQCHSCQLFEANSNSSFRLVQATGASIKIDDVRALSHWVQQTSNNGSNKVVIFEDASKFNLASSNALLKILEEPTDNTYFILINPSSNRLLPTIQSRCQQIVVDSPTIEQAKQSLAFLSHPIDQNFELAFALCHGSIAALVDFHIDQHQDVLETFLSELNNSLKGQTAAVEALLSKHDYLLDYYGSLLVLLLAHNNKQTQLKLPSSAQQLAVKLSQTQIEASYQQWLSIRKLQREQVSINIAMHVYPMLHALISGESRHVG